MSGTNDYKYEGKRVAIYTGTRNLYDCMPAAVKSLVANSNVDEVWLFIEDDKFPHYLGPLPDIVKTRNVSGQTYFKPDNPNRRSQFTYMAMIRTAFTKEFPELDRILSLDVDTFAVKDVSDIWDINIDGNYFSACYEPGRCVNGLVYTNAGVMLQNLSLLRGTEKDDTLIKSLNETRWMFLDQDVYNFYCCSNIVEMDSKYNCNEFTRECSDPSIIHFAGKKNWFSEELYLKWCRVSWDEVLRMHEEVVKAHR